MKYANKYESQIIATGQKNNIAEDIIIQAIDWFDRLIMANKPPKSSMNYVINKMLETKYPLD